MGKLRDLATGYQWEKIPNEVRIAMLEEDARIEALELEAEGAASIIMTERAEVMALRKRTAKADALIDALAPMLDDEPSLDEQRAGRAALAAYRERSDT